MGRKGLGIICAVAACAWARAAAAEPWVDRQLTLPPWQLAFDAGLGGGARGGVGANLEWTLGLPIVSELGVRTGARFDDAARMAGSDAYARLFDPETSDGGAGRWSNPELRWRSSLVDLRFVNLGLEARVVIPADPGSGGSFAPAVPARLRFGKRVRVDTGVYVPLRWGPSFAYSVSVPVALWVQFGPVYAGPAAGVRLGHDTPPFAAQMTPLTDRVDVAAGLGAGISLGEHWDVKASMYTPRINDSDAARFLGFGLGLGVTAP